MDYGIFGNGVVLAMSVEGRRFLGSRRLERVLLVYSISENALDTINYLELVALLRNVTSSSRRLFKSPGSQEPRLIFRNACPL